MEGAQALVVAGKLTLALQDVHFHAGLVVRGGGEDLALLGGDGGVAVDDLGADTAQRLNAQRQRGHVQQQQALHVTLQHAALNGSAHGHALIGVDALERLAVQFLLHRVKDGGDTGGAAHHQHLGQIGGLQTGVGQRLAHGGHGAVHQIGGQLVELGAGQRHVQMLGAGGVGGDEGQVDVGGGGAGQLDLGLLGGLLQTLGSHLVVAQVDVVLTLEVLGHPVDDALVKVVAAQMGVAVGGENLGDAVAHLDDGHVEGAAAQVVDHDLLVGLLVDAVGQRGRSRLVDDALDVQARDGAGVLGGLTLAVVEVGGNGDDRLGDRLAQIRLGVRLQLGEDHGGNFLGGVVLAAGMDLLGGAHLALDGGNGVLRVGDGLTLGDLADQTLAGLGEADHRRRGAGALGVGDDDRLAALHHGDAAVGGAQIDTNNFAHIIYSLSKCVWVFSCFL